MSKRHIATLCLGALGALALSTTALANVRHSSSGNDCQWDDNFLFPTTWVMRHEMTGMSWTDANAGGGNRNFWCPMVRSLPLSTAGTSDLEIVFRGTEEAMVPFGAQAICTAFSLRNDGSVQKIVERQMPIAPRYTDSSGTVVYPITKMDFGAALNVSSNKGNYLLRCTVTQGVGLFSYYHSEVDGIDGN